MNCKHVIKYGWLVLRLLLLQKIYIIVHELCTILGGILTLQIVKETRIFASFLKLNNTPQNVWGKVDDLSFFDYLSPFCFLLIEFHCIF